jgi:nucleoside-diphosphate-sugar epimerase
MGAEDIPVVGSGIRDRSVLVLGATGVVGAAISRRLLAEGAHVIAQGRDLSRLARLQAFGASTVQGDLRMARPRTDLLRVSSDVVAVISFLPPQQDIIRGAGDVMRDLPGTCRAHLSSSEVYARSRDQFDLTEREVRPYGLRPCPFRSAERAFERATQGCVTLLRPGRLIGTGAPSGALVRWARDATLPLVIEGGVETSVLRIEDLGDAIVQLIRAPGAGRAHGAFNLAGPRPMGVRDLAETLCEGSGVRLRWRRAGRTGLRVGVSFRNIMRALPWASGQSEEVGHLLGWSLTLNSAAFLRETGWAPGVIARHRSP